MAVLICTVLYQTRSIKSNVAQPDEQMLPSRRATKEDLDENINWYCLGSEIKGQVKKKQKETKKKQKSVKMKLCNTY